MSFSLPKPLQTVRNIQRLQQILNVFLKYGFGHILQKLNLGGIIGTTGDFLRQRMKRGQDATAELTVFQRLRMAFEELGPTFVKFGQVLSTRPDLLPPDLVLEFRKLQDDVAPFPFSVVRDTLRAELKTDPMNLYTEIDPVPVASASIAQVHYAKLIGGQEVVIKVQRPNIENAILADINLLYYLADLIERYVPEAAMYSPNALVHEFSASIRAELDFIREASNTQQFRKIFEDNPYITSPMVYWELCTRRMLTLERFTGIAIDRFDELDRRGINRKVLAEESTRIFLTEIFDHGFFHADPHPGNVFVLDDGRLGLIDFGMVGRLDAQMRQSLISVTFYIVARDYDRLAREFVTMGIVSETIDMRAFIRGLMDVVEPYYGKPLKYLEVGPIFQQILDLVSTFEARLPPELLTLGRTVVIVEGVGRGLYPDLDLLTLAAPYLTRLVRDRLNPYNVALDTVRFGGDVSEMVKAFPDQLRLLMRKTLRDELEIRHVVHGLEGLNHNIDRAGNRLSLSLIVSSLIIGSTFLLNSHLPPLVWGYPLFGMIGFGTAAVLGAWLAILILRAGRY